MLIYQTFFNIGITKHDLSLRIFFKILFKYGSKQNFKNYMINNVTWDSSDEFIVKIIYLSYQIYFLKDRFYMFSTFRRYDGIKKIYLGGWYFRFGV